MFRPNIYCKRPLVHHFHFIILTTFMLLISGSTQYAVAFQKAQPFAPGERLTIQVKWGFITAGKAILEVLPPEVINGTRSYHFKLTVKTSSFVDLFYKVRDRIDAFTDMEITHSILYKKRKQGKRKKDIVVDFSWGKMEAQYSDFGRKRTPVDILPGSFDPLSVFYAFRLKELKEGLELEAAVTDGKKCVIAKAMVVKKEKIRLAGQLIDTYRVEPNLEHLEGVFEKSENASLKIWVTADRLKLPVKIKSKVVVGSFVGELVSATGLKIPSHQFK